MRGNLLTTLWFGLTTGVLGGAVGTLLVSRPPVHAQDHTPPMTVSTELRSHRFVLVDHQGKQRAVLGFDDPNPSLSFYDLDGKLVLKIGPGQMNAHAVPITGH